MCNGCMKRQNHIDHIEKELQEYYGYKMEISRDRLIARIQKFYDFLEKWHGMVVENNSELETLGKMVNQSAENIIYSTLQEFEERFNDILADK